MDNHRRQHILFWLIALVGAGILSLVLAFLGAAPVPAASPITWTPSAVSETILAGETKNVPVSFTSSESLGNVVVRVVPELQPYVQVTDSITGISKGQTVILNLRISAAASTPPGVIEGTIQVRSNSGKNARNFAKPLPITFNIAWKLLQEDVLSYTLRYPGAWTVATSTSGAVEIFGRVSEGGTPNPGEMAGMCKVMLTSHENAARLSVSDWLRQAEVDSDSPPPIASAPITVGGLTGIKEVIEEIGLTTTAYISSGDKVLSFQLFCGDDTMSEGEAVFSTLIESVSFK